jgi:formate/nitrite transporter FocA (FNT family)
VSVAGEATQDERLRRRRETTESSTEQSLESLTDHEREKVAEKGRLSAVTVYSIIRSEGEEELNRPIQSLWWSGVAAGVGISASVLAEGILHVELEGYAFRPLIENFGYTVGFVLVILSRLQLFTENTISVVLPILSRPSWRRLWLGLRLWGIVFAANMLGTFFTAATAVWPGTVSPEHVEGMLVISRSFAEMQGIDALLYGIPAGFFIASIVWMLPSSKGFEILTIILFTYFIALGHFSHVIAGSTEVFLLMIMGEMTLETAALGLILPTLAGNVIGGTGLFALLAYGQVHEEV